MKKVESSEPKLEDNVDELEKYSRLLFHKVGEVEDENTNDVITKTIKEKMDKDKREEYLDRAHRVGNREVCKEGKSRPIIIKFAPNLFDMMCVVQRIKIKRSWKVKTFR